MSRPSLPLPRSYPAQKLLPLPAEGCHTDIGVSIVILQGAQDVAAQCVIEGVPLLGTVERNAANATGLGSSTSMREYVTTPHHPISRTQLAA